MSSLLLREFGLVGLYELGRAAGAIRQQSNLLRSRASCISAGRENIVIAAFSEDLSLLNIRFLVCTEGPREQPQSKSSWTTNFVSSLKGRCSLFAGSPLNVSEHSLCYSPQLSLAFDEAFENVCATVHIMWSYLSWPPYLQDWANKMTQWICDKWSWRYLAGRIFGSVVALMWIVAPVHWSSSNIISYWCCRCLVWWSKAVVTAKNGWRHFWLPIATMTSIGSTCRTTTATAGWMREHFNEYLENKGKWTHWAEKWHICSPTLVFPIFKWSQPWCNVLFQQGVNLQHCVVNFLRACNHFQEFEGNTDAYTVRHHYFDKPTVVRYIRFHPLHWNRHPSMRVEILGCQSEASFVSGFLLVPISEPIFLRVANVLLQ